MKWLDKTSDKTLRRLTISAFAALAALAFCEPAKAQWTGCGAGVHGGLVVGALDVPGPIDIGSNGQAAGVSINCDYRMNVFVAGAFAEYDWIFGDLKTVGVKNDTTFGGRLGILINAGSLLYTHAGWSRLNTTIGDIDGWKLGLGNEFRVPNSPMYLDLRYTYSRYDISDFAPPGIDANTQTFRVGLNLKFGPGMFGKGPLFTTEDETKARSADPKMPGKP